MINIFLFLGSVLAIFLTDIPSFLYLLFSFFYSYFLGNILKKKKKKSLLFLGISIPLLVLVLVKISLSYPDFFSFISFFGISYFTLEILSYLIDIYRGKIKESDLWTYALYLFYYPCLILGPINRYEDFKKEIIKKKRIKVNNVFQGLFRILIGSCKKLILAGRVSILISSITTNDLQGLYVLFACFLYSILLYADFSGGIDMVLGFSKIFDLDLPENFDTPYFSKSVKEFWRRWHMTLSNWLKDYVYIPLGGNRVSRWRVKINILLTFLVSGFWHGAHYLVWGLVHGLLVIFSKPLKHKWLSTVVTFCLVSLTWVFYVYPDTLMALSKFGSIFTNGFTIDFLSLGLDMCNYVVLLLSVLLLWVYDLKKEKVHTFFEKCSLESKILILGTLCILVLLLGIYGIGFEVNDFIYSKF